MISNRSYVYPRDSRTGREEYPIIAAWVPRGASVIDLGCGDGSLLKLLEEKGVEGEGIELSESGVSSARAKGLKVSQGRIDNGLGFPDKTFDLAICNATLQMVVYPESLLREMKRVARRQIVSFPNFAFILNRLDLLFNGRMPRVGLSGYEWYTTGHLHQLSVEDFRNFCLKDGWRILKQHHFFSQSYLPLPRRVPAGLANVFATASVFLTE